MKKLFVAVVAALSIVACNSNPGPEQTTPAEFGEIVVAPTPVSVGTEVTVQVSVMSEYGFNSVYIAYMLNDDVSDVRFTAARNNLSKEITSFTYKGTIPGQKAGTKVTFWVCALTAYQVASYSAPKEYTIPEEDEESSDTNE